MLRIFLVILVGICCYSCKSPDANKKISQRKELALISGSIASLDLLFNMEYDALVCEGEFMDVPELIKNPCAYKSDVRKLMSVVRDTNDLTLEIKLDSRSSEYVATFTLIHNGAKISINQNGEKKCDPSVLKYPFVTTWIKRGPRELIENDKEYKIYKHIVLDKNGLIN